MRLISDRVYSARLTAKVLLYQKMTFIFHEQLPFLNLPIPFLPHCPLHVHSSLYPIWFPSKPSHRCPMNIFKMLPECVALLLSRRLTATGWSQYLLLGLWISIQLWRATETLTTARSSPLQPQLPCGIWLFWLQTYFLWREDPWNLTIMSQIHLFPLLPAMLTLWKLDVYCSLPLTSAWLGNASQWKLKFSSAKVPSMMDWGWDPVHPHPR